MKRSSSEKMRASNPASGADSILRLVAVGCAMGQLYQTLRPADAAAAVADAEDHQTVEMEGTDRRGSDPCINNGRRCREFGHRSLREREIDGWLVNFVASVASDYRTVTRASKRQSPYP